jgi:hypothetical protein
MYKHAKRQFAYHKPNKIKKSAAVRIPVHPFVIKLFLFFYAVNAVVFNLSVIAV